MNFKADDYLAHHGIKGQKWGVRRFQNSDGSLTEEGRIRSRARNRIVRSESTTKDVEDIISTMNKKEQQFVLAGSDHYLNVEERSTIAKRVVVRDNSGKPVSFFDLLEDGKNDLQVALGTRSGSEYRGKGYASKAAQEAINWVDKNQDKIGQKNLIWGVHVDNAGSIKIAEKNGFKLDENSYSSDGKWVNYVRPVHSKHKIEHSDDEHLMHHGIKGQKWGVRRFQNPDGSLTSEGRKRYLTTDLKKKIYDLRKKSSKKVSDVRKKIAKIRSEKEEADKKSAIAKGDLDRIYRHIDKMSTNEINDAINRATAIKNLKNLSDKKSVLNRLANTAGNLSNYGNKFIDLANTVKRMKELNKKEETKDKDYEDYMRNVKEKAKRAANSARDNTNGSSADKEHAAASVYKRMMNDAKASYDKVKSGDYYKEPKKAEETKGKKLGDHVESLQDKSVRDVAKERSTPANRGNARLAEINKREGWTATSSFDEMAKAHSDEKERKRKHRAKTKTIKIKGSMMGGRSHYAD